MAESEKTPERPIIRGELINAIWDTIYSCIFTESIKPPLTFEEVQIIQNRLSEHIDSTKFKIQMRWALLPDEEEPTQLPPSATYVQ